MKYFTQKIKKFCITRRGLVPSSDPLGGGHPSPHPSLSPPSINASSALDLSTLPPLKLKSDYAIDCENYLLTYYSMRRDVLL